MAGDELLEALELIQSEALAKVEELSSKEFAEKVSVRWNPRMRSSAGRARLVTAEVELNPRLVSVSLDEVRRTLLHELAHLLVYHRYGLKVTAHGVEWRNACAELGIPGESVTHSLGFPRRKMQKKWEYRCDVCSKSIYRVRRARSASACYHCCNEHNNGKFSVDFLLREKRIEGSPS